MRGFKVTERITKRETHSIKKYFDEISAYPILTAEEESELAFAMKNGDERARQKLINHNLRFVISVAKQFQDGTLDFEDLVNEGNIGLVKAAETFDPSRGFKFISYAVWKIRQRILVSINKNSKTIRVPSNKIGSNIKMSKELNFFEQKLQRSAGYDEIVDLFEDEYSEDEIHDFLNKHRNFSRSLDEPLGDEADGGSFIETIVREDNDTSPTHYVDMDDRETKKRILLSGLSKTEIRILTLTLGLDGERPKNLVEVGEELGMSGPSVGGYRDRALRKLRVKLKKQGNWITSD